MKVAIGITFRIRLGLKVMTFCLDGLNVFIGSWKAETIGMFMPFFLSQLDVDGVALGSACSVPYSYIESFTCHV
jgi:hypothetical protein